jgi:hypothetical protein
MPGDAIAFRTSTLALADRIGFGAQCLEPV